MGNTVRFGISLDEKLLESFDQLIEQKSYMNRSEAIRDLIRASLVEERLGSEDQEAVGTVTLVYNHHVRQLSERLTGMQHEYHHNVLSTLHVHLDHDHCLEVLVLKGKASIVQRVADALIATRGVKHGRLTITASGAGL